MNRPAASVSVRMAVPWMYTSADAMGVLGGSRFWTTVFGLSVGWRLFKRLTDPTPKLLTTEVLEPGDTLVVAHGRVAEDTTS